MSGLMCLWCRDARRHFDSADALLAHLRNCHGRYKYRLQAPLTVCMSLLTGVDALLATSMDKLRVYSTESVYVNSARYPRYHRLYCAPTTVGSATKKRARVVRDDDDDYDLSVENGNEPREDRSNNEPTPEDATHVLQRYTRTRLASHVKANGAPDTEFLNGCVALIATANGKGADGTGSSGAGGKGKAARARGSTAKGAAKTRASFPSVETAVAEKRLFHSVLQSPLCMEEFASGADSDGDDRDQEWRLELANDELNEYLDTTCAEKLFMNLWNQFTVEVYAVYADRRVAPACLLFARSKCWHGATFWYW